MALREFKISLPDNIAQEAEKAGLLKPKAVEQMFRSAVWQKRRKTLFKVADQLADLNLPPLTEEELDAEIQAAHRERHNPRESRS